MTPFFQFRLFVLALLYHLRNGDRRGTGMYGLSSFSRRMANMSSTLSAGGGGASHKGTPPLPQPLAFSCLPDVPPGVSPCLMCCAPLFDSNTRWESIPLAPWLSWLEGPWLATWPGPATCGRGGGGMRRASICPAGWPTSSRWSSWQGAPGTAQSRREEGAARPFVVMGVPIGLKFPST